MLILLQYAEILLTFFKQKKKKLKTQYKWWTREILHESLHLTTPFFLSQLHVVSLLTSSCLIIYVVCACVYSGTAGMQIENMSLLLKTVDQTD